MPRKGTQIKLLLAWTIVLVFAGGVYLSTFESAVGKANRDRERFGRFDFINSDDGTEVNSALWFGSGALSHPPHAVNRIGRDFADRYETGFRFHPNALTQGQNIAYARVRLPAYGGRITSSVSLLIEGVLEKSPTTFSQKERPSQKGPPTTTSVPWTITEWGENRLHKKVPLYFSSPDVSPIINEIISLPGWGTGKERKALILTLKENGNPANETNFVSYYDYHSKDKDLRTPAVLEVYPTVYDTFLGRELPGRVTDRSAVINLYSLIETDTYIEYGTAPGIYTDRTGAQDFHAAEKAIEFTLDNLLSDRTYYYRLAYRRAGVGNYEKGFEGTFRTQRARGEPFTFAIQADSHLQNMVMIPHRTRNLELYKTTHRNIANGKPDFLISLGDFANTELDDGRNAYNQQEAIDRYLMQRQYLGEIIPPIPFYLVLGNHEGEQGWYLHRDEEHLNKLPIISTIARKELIPNPAPDGFYGGNASPDVRYGLGLRESYYSWEWGDALFVVLDPFWFTANKPHNQGYNGTGTQDGWDWTLGEKQYRWLYQTLHESTAKWKLIFIHHLTSTTTAPWTLSYSHYGRGGIEVAKYSVKKYASYEWGGEDDRGRYVFQTMRPGWPHGAVHDLLVSEHVNLVFHGHDHCFAKQDLDGIVYLECPRPADAEYSMGYWQSGLYTFGKKLPNSGHVEVTVDPLFVKIDYIRAFLPGEGDNGTTAYSVIVQ
jgi:hypothetical protein